jgi:hypothetical protein
VKAEATAIIITAITIVFLIFVVFKIENINCLVLNDNGPGNSKERDTEEPQRLRWKIKQETTKLISGRFSKG